MITAKITSLERSVARRYPFLVRAYETDANNQLKISSVFNFMQVAAGLNANQLGFGYDHLTPKGYFWVLSRVILEWNGKISFDEELDVETWPKGVEKFFALRDFNFYNSSGECIGNATTAWLMMDQQKGRPLLLSREMFHLPDFNLAPAIDEVPGKLTEYPDLSRLATRKAVYSDIDVNQHVNNAKYIEYIFDALPHDESSKFKSCRVQINYLKELKLKDSFSLLYTRTDAARHAIYVEARKEDQQKIFQSELSFKL